MTRSPSTPGRRPYGFSASERLILERIILLRRAEMTWQEIADALNACGQMQRNGKPWTASGVAGKHPQEVRR